MDEANKDAVDSNAVSLTREGGSTVYNYGTINMNAGRSGTIGNRALGKTELKEHRSLELDKVDEPSKDDEDLIWLSNGKIAFYKGQCLSKTAKTVFCGRQQLSPDYWRKVAIKVIKREHGEMDVNELKLLKDLSHPNIVRLFDAGIHRGGLSDDIYIVMELCSQTLTTYVKNNPFHFQTSFSFVKQIVDGLEYLHKRNVIHRDLKPDNVLFSQCKKIVKLSDFGLSKEIPVGLSSATVSRVGVGTDGYRAPETYQSPHRVSCSIDIFPFGLVTYFIFTNGKHPYGTNPYEWPVNITKNQNRDLSQIPQFKKSHTNKRERLINLLEKTLQHHPEDRPTIKEIKQSAFITDVAETTKGGLRHLELIEATRAVTDFGGTNIGMKTENVGENGADVSRRGGKRKHKELMKDSERTPAMKKVKYVSDTKTGEPQHLESIELTQTIMDIDQTDIEMKTEKPPLRRSARLSMKSSTFQSQSETTGRTSSTSDVENDGVGGKSGQRKSEEPILDDSDPTVAKNRIKHELKQPLNEVGFTRSAQLLSELRELRGSDDLDTLLQMAECELQLARGKEEESIQRTRDFISTSGSYSALNVREIAEKFYESRSYVRSLILYRISNDLHKSQNVSPDDAVKWIRNRVLDVFHAAEPLIKAGGRSRDIGIKYGLEYMETLLNDLRSVKNVTSEFRVINEADCLNSITFICIVAGEYQKSIRFTSEGIEVLEKQFGSDASKHKIYGMLLHNLGTTHHNSGHYSDAEPYYVRAIEAYEKALDYENENKKREEIEKTKRNLANTRRFLGKQK